MEIKKREVIASVVIVALMLIIGFAISEKIRQRLLEDYQVYDTATQIDDDKELFEYGMKTNVGYAFVYGELKTLDPVSYPEVSGKYSYIKKEEQEYRRHSRKVTRTYTDSKGKTHTKTEIEYYWTWDTMRTESKTANKISFLDIEFAYEKIPFPSSHQLEIVKTGYHKRNVYYGTETEFRGTIFTSLKENTINNTKFYKSQTIAETIEALETGTEIVIFWILWILLIIGLVIGFYYLENKWLD
ncbi:MAG: hypothetical protein HFJ33_02780 [Clostridia bacterium]|nr:hypothetical protein [Clostridia bacterium]